MQTTHNNIIIVSYDIVGLMAALVVLRQSRRYNMVRRAAIRLLVLSYDYRESLSGSYCRNMHTNNIMLNSFNYEAGMGRGRGNEYNNFLCSLRRYMTFSYQYLTYTLC